MPGSVKIAAVYNGNSKCPDTSLSFYLGFMGGWDGLLCKSFFGFRCPACEFSGKSRLTGIRRKGLGSTLKLVGRWMGGGGLWLRFFLRKKKILGSYGGVGSIFFWEE